MSSQIDEAKKRLVGLVTYIKEVKTRLNSPAFRMNDYEWKQSIGDLPRHPYIKLFNLDDPEGRVLCIKKPKEVRCPSPPSILDDWITTSWKKIDSDIHTKKSRNFEDDKGQIQTEMFEDVEERVSALKEWTVKRNKWKEAELPNENVRRVFSRFFELEAKIDKESEMYQLFIGDGNLCLNHPEYGVIDHPIIFKELTITFITDKEEPEFVLSSNDSDVCLNTGLLRVLGVSGINLNTFREKIDDMSVDPLDSSNTNGFLNTVMHKHWQDGEVYDDDTRNPDGPCIYRNQFLYLGKKQDRVLDQIDSYIDQVSNITEVPEIFSNIIGLAEDAELPDSYLPPVPGSGSSLKDKKIDYFLTKEANLQQKRIIEVLERKGQVGVQGPPGTGKSHTIANLIGHLLAKGKTILVTSYTPKALSVIRDKVVDELRPLCVSAIDNSRESKKELESSINFIDEMLSKKNKEDLEREIIDFGNRREKFEKEIDSLKSKLFEAVRNEYVEIVIGQESLLPSKAGRFLAENISNNWIPGYVNQDYSPLSDDVFNETILNLYNVCIDEQVEILNGIPEPGELISPEDLKNYLEHSDNVMSEHMIKHRSIIERDSVDFTLLEKVLKEVETILSELDSLDKWKMDIVENSLRGPEYTKIYDEFEKLLSSKLPVFQSRAHLLNKYKPTIAEHEDPKALITALGNMSKGKGEFAKFSMWNSVFNSEIKFIKNNSKVKNVEPKTYEEYQSIIYFLENKIDRNQLCSEWDHITTDCAPCFQTEREPEVLISKVHKQVVLWKKFSERLSKITDSLSQLGVTWPTKRHDELFSDASQDYRYTNTLIMEFKDIIYPGLFSMYEKLKCENSYVKIGSSIKYLESAGLGSNVCARLLQSLRDKNVVSYQDEIKKLLRICENKSAVIDSVKVLERINESAPKLYDAILERKIEGITNYELSKGWYYNRLSQFVDKLSDINISEIQKDIYERNSALKKINENYIECLVWRNQLQRNGLKERQALNGWLNNQKRITKGGKTAVDQLLKKEAKSLLKKCKSAVPVWIMPISKLLDNFNLGETVFDVMIIDEASQANMTNLITFAFAKKVVVVGDDKQVRPPGLEVDKLGVQGLIDEYLSEIPNRRNYDLKHSIYDIASESFGQPIRLEEHFRCVPEIIQFCNDLSYDGKIKVLRESTSNPTNPAVVSHRVVGKLVNDINIPEAEEIVSLIMAMIELPEYKDAHFGVISLKGQKQHVFIDNLLRQRLGEQTYHSRKILCGKAGQFQGDEREVILLSMVDVPKDGPLRMTTAEGDRQKEYNVAVSRAKNQLWVVHSLNPEVDLKPGDIRLRLISHSINPNAIVEQLKIDGEKADSEFEKQVHADLRRKEIDFVPQYEIGSFKIDIVVFTENGSKVAIECDGDKYHSSESAVRNDLERQAILERLGLKFIRIRGSEYYRNKDNTMKSVFKRLEELGVVPSLSKGKKKATLDNELSNRVRSRAVEICLSFKEQLDE